MTRIEHFNEADAPRPNRLIPAASAVVTDTTGGIVLVKRTDNELWTIPGGAMEPGESIAECCRREVLEESGYQVSITGLVGLYTNPRHVVEYSDGEVRQQFSVCFAARIEGGSGRPSSETSQVNLVHPSQLDDYEMHPSIRLRIDHYLEDRSRPFIG